jgi:hypothetical protein
MRRLVSNISAFCYAFRTALLIDCIDAFHTALLIDPPTNDRGRVCIRISDLCCLQSSPCLRSMDTKSLMQVCHRIRSVNDLKKISMFINRYYLVVCINIALQKLVVA